MKLCWTFAHGLLNFLPNNLAEQQYRDLSQPPVEKSHVDLTGNNLSSNIALFKSFDACYIDISDGLDPCPQGHSYALCRQMKQRQIPALRGLHEEHGSHLISYTSAYRCEQPKFSSQTDSSSARVPKLCYNLLTKPIPVLGKMLLPLKLHQKHITGKRKDYHSPLPAAEDRTSLASPLGFYKAPKSRKRDGIRDQFLIFIVIVVLWPFGMGIRMAVFIHVEKEFMWCLGREDEEKERGEKE
ncbi:hypothetical protein HGM15179_005894 [Zosterops borbonicus]|uniref:Uncharacterized protein n=1 Tax=Zosterops borbonicus TaxID=364589 RepID=A0A8K1GPM9_9PASS|nr:hypothetical protein HGM15179_005894 [Zosterops borbonicus]